MDAASLSYKSSKHLEAAETALGKAAKLKRDDQNIWYSLALCQAAGGKLEAALASVSRTWQLCRSDSALAKKLLPVVICVLQKATVQEGKKGVFVEAARTAVDLLAAVSDASDARERRDYEEKVKGIIDSNVKSQTFENSSKNDLDKLLDRSIQKSANKNELPE